MERGELLRGEPNPGKDKSSAQTRDFDSNTKPNHYLLVKEAFSEHLLHASTLLRNIHKSEQVSKVGTEVSSDYNRSRRSIYISGSCAGPSHQGGQRTSRT